VLFGGCAAFHEFVVQTARIRLSINIRLLGHKIVGGFPMKRIYRNLGTPLSGAARN